MDINISSTPMTDRLEECERFLFVLVGVFVGFLCIFGFMTNGLVFVVCWIQKGSCPLVRMMLILSVLDGVLLWMIFLNDVIPGLAHIAPFMRHCTTVCDFVNTLTSPILFIVHTCSSWMVVFIASIQFLLICRPLQANKQCSTHNIHKTILLLLLAATLSSIPIIFEKQVTITSGGNSNNTSSSSSTTLKNHWLYRGLYTNAYQFLSVYLVPVVISAVLGVMLFYTERKQERELNVITRTHNFSMTRLVISLTSVYVFTTLMPMVFKIITWSSLADRKCGHVQFYLSAFSKLFISANASGKFALYCLFMPRFVKHLQNTFRWRTLYDNLEPFGYKCSDFSEMTLLSTTESGTQ